jgi:hypothetical protein
MTAPTTKPLHEDVPTSVAWVVGRRIYVRCGKESKLNQGLIELGSTWDWDERARWAGTTKRAAVTALVLAHMERIKQIEAVKALGHWITIPRGADSLHNAARDAGGLWDKPTGRWAMPTDEARAALTEQVEAFNTEQAALRAQQKRERDEARRRAEQEDREYAVVLAEQNRARIVASCGRVTIGEQFTASHISTRYMDRSAAEAQAWPIGEVRQLRDGRRVLVLERRIWFTGEQSATDLCWHSEAPDEAHWDFSYTVIAVEPTAPEREADEIEAATLADGKALYALFHDTQILRAARAVDDYTAVPEQDRVGTIEGSAGSIGSHGWFDTGRVILAQDGRVLWQHPGHYDDWTRTEAVLTDDELVQRVRDLIAVGPRKRMYHHQLTDEFTITVPAPEA